MITALPFRPARLLPLLVVGALALSACSSSGSDTGSSDATGGRTVSTPLGDVTVPETIESVVVLEGRVDLDIVLSLGLPLGGFPREVESTDLESPLAELEDAAIADGAKDLFLAGEINVEAIAEAAPSLIIGNTDSIEPIQDDLEDIAPVIAIGDHSDGGSWRDDLEMIAEATGTEDRATELLATYDARFAEVKKTYATQIADTSVASFGYNDGVTRILPTRMQVTTLVELGAQPSAGFAEGIANPDGVEFGPEQTYDKFADAEALLVVVNDGAVWDELQTDPLWTSLPAVQQDHVIRTDRMTFQGGPTTALATLDLIAQMYETV